MRESLEEYIRLHSINTPNKVAVVSNGTETTYSELWQLVLDKASELKSQGVLPGDVFVVRSSQTLDYLVLYFALHYIEKEF